MNVTPLFLFLGELTCLSTFMCPCVISFVSLMIFSNSAVCLACSFSMALILSENFLDDCVVDDTPVEAIADPEENVAVPPDTDIACWAPALYVCLQCRLRPNWKCNLLLHTAVSGSLTSVVTSPTNSWQLKICLSRIFYLELFAFCLYSFSQFENLPQIFIARKTFGPKMSADIAGEGAKNIALARNVSSWSFAAAASDQHLTLTNSSWLLSITEKTAAVTMERTGNATCQFTSQSRGHLAPVSNHPSKVGQSRFV